MLENVLFIKFKPLHQKLWAFMSNFNMSVSKLHLFINTCWINVRVASGVLFLNEYSGLGTHTEYTGLALGLGLKRFLFNQVSSIMLSRFHDTEIKDNACFRINLRL